MTRISRSERMSAQFKLAIYLVKREVEILSLKQKDLTKPYKHVRRPTDAFGES
jgi:hypothetical protein